jgi:hypothetical protein
MVVSPNPNGETTHSEMRDLKWSASEKAIARKAFDLALGRELEEVMIKAKKWAEKIRHPSDLWELERYLYESRKQINQKYDYRYSVLPMVFGVLIRQGRLTERDLRGLREDKLGYIRRYLKL